MTRVRFPSPDSSLIKHLRHVAHGILTSVLLLRPFKLNVKQRKLITERRREGQPLQKIAADLGVGTDRVASPAVTKTDFRAVFRTIELFI